MKSHQEHPCCGKPAGAPDCGSYEHHAGTVEVWERNGYIPEGGVWTAAEREAFRLDTCAAARTVAALDQALEDVIDYAMSVEPHHPDAFRIYADARALLAAVKK